MQIWNTLNLIEFTRTCINLKFGGFVLPIRWYGLSYIASYLIITHEIKRKLPFLNAREFNNLSSISMWGGIIGGRLWYLVFRYFEYRIPFNYHPFHVWEGGMAFQGGLILGFIFGVSYLFYIKKQKYFPKTVDVVMTKIPIGIMIGRLGNFANNEFMNPIFGMPSCIFASITEGLIPFLFLNCTFPFDQYTYLPSILFFVLYALMRFINDIYREEFIYSIFSMDLKFSQLICLGIITTCFFISIFLSYKE